MIKLGNLVNVSAFVHSTAEYCDPALLNTVVSQQPHSPHQQTHQQRTTCSNWLPMPHSIGKSTSTGRHKTSGSPTKKSHETGQKNQTIYCMIDSALGSPNNKSILNAEDHLCLLRLSIYKTSQNKAPLKINGLTTNGTTNGKKKVYPNITITL